MTFIKDKTITLETEARRALVRGFDKVADLVKTTLGPKGRNIVIERVIGYPLITKDGVTVAKHIHLSDSQENIGAQLCREVAVRTNELVGDGTTTSIVLAQAILHGGMKLIEAGLNPGQLRKGIEKASELVIQEILNLSVGAETSEKIADIASIASKNKKVGEIIARAIEKVGPDGIITVRETPERRTYVQVAQGMELAKGYLSPYFSTDGEHMLAELENSFVLLTDSVLDNPEEVKRVLNWCIWEKRPLLIIATDVTKDVLGTLIAYKNEGKVKVVAVQAPSYAENRQGILDDLAVLTGGSLVTETLGLSMKQLEKSMLGQAEKITVSHTKTIVLGNKSVQQNLKDHLRQLKVLLTQASGLEEQEKLKERIAHLAGGIATIWVGADTEIAMKELKDRVIDALQATKAAIEGGIVPGGGAIFLHAAKILAKVEAECEDELAGIRLVQQALSEPLRQIVVNAGENANQIIEICRAYSSEIGYDARNKDFGDLFALGIVDSAKVAVTAFRNAVGIASILLTTEGLIAKPLAIVQEPIIW